MILARPICSDRPAELQLAFARLGLPTAAGDYLLEKLPHQQVLLSGLSAAEGRFLKQLAEESVAPGREEYPAFVSGDQRHRPGSALLTGRREQFQRLIRRAQQDESLGELALALERSLAAPTAPQAMELGERRFDFGTRTYLMGIVNVTPDSFSDGGRHRSAAEAVEHGIELARAGADILDVGGESTRPGAPPVDVEEELSRVLPVIRGLHEHCPEIPISVDTTKAVVARQALAAGARLVNDVSGFTFDSELPRVVAEANAAACLMHIRGTPRTMQRQPEYGDVMEEVLLFLAQSLDRAQQAGIPRERLMVDPGIGFGKTVGHNLALLRRLPDLRVLGVPVLVGTSRKSFLGHLMGGKPPGDRLAGTIASVVASSIGGGADFVRVHDVAEVRDALWVADAIRQATDAGSLFSATGKSNSAGK